MIKGKNGCKYFASKWFIPIITIKLSLQPFPANRLSISTLLSLGNKERERPFTWLRIPCKQVKISALQIAYLAVPSHTNKYVGNTKDIVSSLKVIMFKTVDMHKGINPSVVVPLYRRCLDEKWKADIDNHTFHFEASMYKYNMHKNYIKDETNKSSEANTKSYYIKFAEGPRMLQDVVNTNAITLTKPFFCNQVSSLCYIKPFLHFR